MTDDLVKRVDSLVVLLNMERKKSLSLGKHIEKLGAALIAIKAMHHEGGIDDIEERDDRTYFMVCNALEELR